MRPPRVPSLRGHANSRAGSRSRCWVATGLGRRCAPPQAQASGCGERTACAVCGGTSCVLRRLTHEVTFRHIVTRCVGSAVLPAHPAALRGCGDRVIGTGRACSGARGPARLRQPGGRGLAQTRGDGAAAARVACVPVRARVRESVTQGPGAGARTGRARACTVAEWWWGVADVACVAACPFARSPVRPFASAQSVRRCGLLHGLGGAAGPAVTRCRGHSMPRVTRCRASSACSAARGR